MSRPGRSCRGKRRYRDQQEATNALRAISRSSKRQTKPSRAYQCPSCRGWHLTAQDKRT